mmetsp:Transcript_69471/g.151202  ORF Transcript_69471/g.151202 Transcript_69471/m.151202 type:complete len:343 (+) Transcript_69471:113-1141(+)
MVAADSASAGVSARTISVSWIDQLNPQQKSLGLVAMLGSSFFFSIMALLVKVLTRFKAFELVFWRSVFMTMITTSICLKNGLRPFGRSGERGVLVLRGVAGFLFMASYYAALQILPLSDAVVIAYTSPVITAIAAVILLGEKMSPLDVIGSLLCMVGVVLVAKPSFVMQFFGEEVEELPFNGVMGALGAALFSTSVYILLRFAKKIEPMVATNYFAMIGIVLSPMAGYAAEEKFVIPTGLEWLLLVLLAVLSVVGQNLMNIGLALETAGKATAMNYTQVVFSYAYQLVLLHEASDMQSVIGAALIASWGVIALLKEKKKAVEAREGPLIQILPIEEGYRMLS